MKSMFSINKVQKSLLFWLLTVLFFSACKQDTIVKRTTTLYAYEVDKAAEIYSAGVLKYMEASYYEGKRLITKTYYNNDQSVKGEEKYEYTSHDSLPTSSKYYDGNGVLQAIYTFTNKDNHQVQRDGYDGSTNQLLRQERYQYDKEGNRVSKILFDSQNLKQKTFLFGHDTYGNEKQMKILDFADKEIITEEYEIASIDNENRWRERWGYVSNEKFPRTFYRQTY